MYILAIETTGFSASVAIINEEGIVDFEFSNDKLNHLQNLISMTKMLLDKKNITMKDIDLIAVSEGPGSFTGIRIGVSTARALGQAMGIKIIPVPTLEAFSYNLKEFNGIICPIFDARRQQVYSGAYIWDDEKNHIIEKVSGKAYNLDNLLEKLEEVGENQEIMFFGDGILAYEENIEEWSNNSSKGGITVKIAPANIRYQHAESVAKLALKLYGEGKAIEFNEVKPVYMRKSEAERKLEEGCLNV